MDLGTGVVEQKIFCQRAHDCESRIAMDHLPEIHDPLFPPIEIAYLDPDEHTVLAYDNLAFTSFPERAGWNKEHLFCRSINRDQQTVAAFIQQWLFFGVLSTFLDHRYSMETLTEDFTRISHNTNRKIVTTRKLEQYLKDIRPEPNTVTGINDMLRELRQYVERYMCAEPRINHYLRDSEDCQALFLSIQSLGVVLTRAKLNIWPHNSIGFAWQWSQIVDRRMSEAGWCPSDMEMFHKLLTASGLYFIHCFPPRLGERNHVEAGCTRDDCKVMNISGEAKQAYRPVHVIGCDKKCGEHEVKVDKLRNILTPNSRRIPLVRFVTEGDAQLKLSDSTKDREIDRYIAISHVWAEGLGNTLNNSLPTCQLTRIQRLVDNVSGIESTPFWMDTLCVPQDNYRPELQEARREAIYTMDEVYKKCSAVLVLDSALLSTSVQAPLEQKLVRIACSSWLRRLWTLQEGVLGPRIMLQFVGGSLDMMKDLINYMENFPRTRELSQTVYTELVNFIYGIAALRTIEKADTRIIKLWNVCQFRSTSESQDEAVCLSILLGNNIRPIMAAPGADRWTTFLLQQRVFPKDLLFTAGARVERDGFRWAPARFIRRPSTTTATLDLNMGTGEASEDGFNVQSAGFIFAPLRAPFWANPWINLFDQTTGRWYRVSGRRAPNDGLMSWADLINRLQHAHKAGLMLNKNLDIEGRAFGVFVEILQEEVRALNVLRVRFLHTTNVQLEANNNLGHIDLWSALLQVKQKEDTNDPINGSYGTITPTRVPEDQMWCVR